MIRRDKLTLRNLITVILGSTTLALLIGVSCLARFRPSPPAETAQSAGDLPLGPASITRITSAEFQGGSATGTPEVPPRTSPPPEPTATEAPTSAQPSTTAPLATPAPRVTVQVFVPPPAASSSPSATINQSPIPPEDAGSPLPDDGGPAPDVDAALAAYGLFGPLPLMDGGADAASP